MRTLKFKRILALTLAMLTAILSLGCSLGELGETVELIGDVLDIAADVLGETPEQPDPFESLPESHIPPDNTTSPPSQGDTDKADTIDEDGQYSSKDEVALYIHIYGRLPKNFMTKSEAGKLGWEGGSLEKYAPGCLIGGDRFGNREGLLPDEKGRTYTECDIDTLGKSSRGAKRIVFSNDGLVYYTDDHYESFELLYGEE